MLDEFTKFVRVLPVGRLAIALPLLLIAFSYRWQAASWGLEQGRSVIELLVAPLQLREIEDVDTVSGVVVSALFCGGIAWIVTAHTPMWREIGKHLFFYRWQQLLWNHFLVQIVQAHMLVFATNQISMLAASVFVPPAVIASQRASPTEGSAILEPTTAGSIDTLMPFILHFCSSLFWIAANSPLLNDAMGQGNTAVQLAALLNWFFGIGVLRVIPPLAALSGCNFASLLLHIIVNYPLTLIILGAFATLPSKLVGPSMLLTTRGGAHAARGARQPHPAA